MSNEYYCIDIGNAWICSTETSTKCWYNCLLTSSWSCKYIITIIVIYQVCIKVNTDSLNKGFSDSTSISWMITVAKFLFSRKLSIKLLVLL